MNQPDHITDAELNAYVDNELDSLDRDRIEQWLANHPEDASRVAEYRQQNAELHALYDPVLDEPVPAAMLERVKEPTLRPSTKLRPLMQIAAAILLMVAGGAIGWGLRDAQPLPPTSSTPDYVQRAVGAHFVYASEVLHPVEVAASQQDHLVAWLSKRLGSPLRAPKLEKIGFQLVGGRLLEQAGSPAAQFMYEDKSGRRVTIYVRANDSKDTAFKFFSKGDVSAFYWIDAPFAYALSGEMPRKELINIAHVVYKDLTG